MLQVFLVVHHLVVCAEQNVRSSRSLLYVTTHEYPTVLITTMERHFYMSQKDVRFAPPSPAHRTRLSISTMPTQKRGARRSAHRRKRKALDEKGGGSSQTVQVYDWEEEQGLIPIPPLFFAPLLHAIKSHENENDPPSLPPSMEINVEKWKTLWSLWNSLKKNKTTKQSIANNASHFHQPTAIQWQAWPLLLTEKQSHSVLISPTGSGKTFAYGLPLVVDAVSTQSRSGIQGIVIVPTRELALQVQSSLHRIIAASLHATVSSVNVVACYGGVQSSQEQMQLLTRAVFVTATPGRLLDLLPQLLPPDQPDISVFSPRVTVILDEADRLATHGDLSQQVEQIWQFLRQQSNTFYRIILCSATWPQRATSVWKNWWSNPFDASTKMKDAQNICTVITIDTMAIQTTNPPITEGAHITSKDDDGTMINAKSATDVDLPSLPTSPQNNTTDSTKRGRTTRDESIMVSKIPSHLKQVLHVCAEHKKPKKLLHTLDILFGNTAGNTSASPPPTGIIFFDKIKTIQYVYQLLEKERPHIPCAPWHSQLHASQRERVFSQFIRGGEKSAKSSVLLATDVAARGVHTANLQFVIHYDFPSNIEQYVHRCGRAGRGSSSETSSSATIYSFFTRNLAPLAPDMIALLEATNQWIDPNLRDLVSKSNNSTQRAVSAGAKQEDDPTMNDFGDDDEDDPFIQQLSANRIVLTRASQVSDASSSECDDETGGA
jgi:superfamily II DNA/RNA helicase